MIGHLFTREIFSSPKLLPSKRMRASKKRDWATLNMIFFYLSLTFHCVVHKRWIINSVKKVFETHASVTIHAGTELYVNKKIRGCLYVEFDPGRFSTRVKRRVELDSLHRRFLC